MKYQSMQLIREKLRARAQFIDYSTPVEGIQDFKPIKVEIPNHQRAYKPKTGWYMFFKNSLP